MGGIQGSDGEGTVSEGRLWLPLEQVRKRQGGHTCGRVCGTENLSFHLDGLLCKAVEGGGGRSDV